MPRFSALASILVVVLAAFAAQCASAPSETQSDPGASLLDPAVADTVVFAGGCFWCMEKPFESIPGVASVVSGFAGGRVANPTYEEVSSKTTGHYESVEVIFDKTQVSYDTLLRVFWHNIDPFQTDGQFCDRGSPYLSAIFVGSDVERAAADSTKLAIADEFGLRVATEILPDAPFYTAEDYHQNFYKTNPGRYNSYRAGCGRDARLDELWEENAGHAGATL